jgi:hypothetical protein
MLSGAPGMTIAYSVYGKPTPDSTDLNHTAPRIRYKCNIYNLGNWMDFQKYHLLENPFSFPEYKYLSNVI